MPLLNTKLKSWWLTIPVVDRTVRCLSCAVCVEVLWLAHPFAPHSYFPGILETLVMGLSSQHAALAFFSQDPISSVWPCDIPQNSGLWEVLFILPLYSQVEHLLCSSEPMQDCPIIQDSAQAPLSPWSFLGCVQCQRLWPSLHSQYSSVSPRQLFFMSSYEAFHQTEGWDDILSICWCPPHPSSQHHQSLLTFVVKCLWANKVGWIRRLKTWWVWMTTLDS